MARTIGKLSPARVKSASRPGMYGDGGGLWLNVGPTGGKSWVYRYMLNGRAREMGLGPLHTIGLAEARERAAAARRMRLDGIDPLDTRASLRAERTAREAAAVTFRQGAESYVRAHRAAWRNEKHAAQWTATLEAHVLPVIGALPVATVDTGHVTRVLEPIWISKAETAARVRGRIEAILDYARTHGWRDGENPARWRGHLENVLPARGKLGRVRHHAALPWRETGAFMAALRAEAGVPARALEFAILTAARTGETIGATWAEIDMEDGAWTIPAHRMKGGREHRVPLSGAALAVLGEVARLCVSSASNAPVFGGGKGGGSVRGLGEMAMRAALRRMGRGDLTVHGFRSTFRDWAAETTGYQREVVEAALAHTIESRVEAAYRRGDLFGKRRRLMEEWAAFSGRIAADDTASVVPLRGMTR